MNDEEYREYLAFIDDAGQLLDGNTEDPGESRRSITGDIRLEDDFWAARPLLKQIRAAAWSTRTHPDAVLGAVLARVASMVSPGLKFDSGADGGQAAGSTNLFCCLLAPSGVGKSKADAAAAALMVVPDRLAQADGEADFDRYRCGVGIGSGEGLIEAYMGTGTRIVVDETGMPVVDRKGNPKEETYKLQTRGNAFFYVDEGQMLNKLLAERRGSTLGPTLRSAWNGSSLGQSNASQETTRHLAAGAYSLGLVVGYQYGTAAELLSDAGPGTPQRFLWFGAQDRQMSRETAATPWPGRLPLPPMPLAGVIGFDQAIKDELLDYDIAKHTGEIEVSELDSHSPLMRCKLAAILALLDGRTEVGLPDWDLAEQINDVSSRIRAQLEAVLAAVEQAKRDKRRQEISEDDQARRSASNDVIRVGRRIARNTRDRGEIAWVAWRRDCGRDKRYADDALRYAEAQGWVVPMDDGNYRIGNYSE